MRQVKEFSTSDGLRYRVRYRLDGSETSETFPRRADAEMFRDLLGNGKDGRLRAALEWLESRRSGAAARELVTFGTWWRYHLEQLTDVTPGTLGDYESLHRRYFAHFDGLPLMVLSREHITALVNKMDRAGRAPKTIKQTIYLLSSVFERAIAKGEMTANPCADVRLPDNRLGEVEPRFLTDKEFRRLIDEIPAYYQPLVVLLFGTGMRWAEATALEGRHVNLDAGTIRVEQAWKRVPSQGHKIGPPKTRKARRTVNPATIALAAAASAKRGDRELLFVARSGGPVTHANFYNNIWVPACRRAGLDPRPRIHDARHTHASWLISDGVTLVAVQDQLGHESIETTRKVYGHLLPAVGVAVGKSASAALKRAMASRTLPALNRGE